MGFKRYQISVSFDQILISLYSENTHKTIKSCSYSFFNCNLFLLANFPVTLLIKIIITGAKLSQY